MTLSQFLLLQAINAFFFPFFFAFLEFVRPVISFSVFFLVIVISFIMASIVRCQEQQNNKMQFSFHFFPSSNCWNKEDGTLLLSLGLSKRFHNFNDLKFFLDYGREKVANFTLLPVYWLHFRKHQKVKVLSKSCANIFPWSSFSGALALCRALKFHLEVVFFVLLSS